MGVRRPDPVRDGVPSDRAAADPGWSARYPAIAGMVFDSVYEDGNSRVTSTLMILAEQGVVKVCCNDRDNSRSTWVSGRTVDEALEALERALEAGSADWRVRQEGRGSGPRRK